MTKWRAERTDEQAPTEEEFPAEFKEIKIKIADLNREGQAITSRIYQTNPQAQQNHYQNYLIEQDVTTLEIIEP